MWVWEVNGRSVGFAQDYRIADHPDYALLCGHPDAVGFDYAIGEQAYAGRGLGTSLLWVFLRDLVAPGYADATELFAAPDHRNAASRRVLAKLGAVGALVRRARVGRRPGRHRGRLLARRGAGHGRVAVTHG
jgi:RimJ/RimL family protein N-acetyltransferase